jgi:hypothetical protein
MAGKNKVRLALLVAAVVWLMPAETFAGQPSGVPPEPGPVYPAPYYSPCHYWTPLLYRCWAKCYYGVCGHRYELDYYPTAACAEPVLSPPATPARPGTAAGADKSAPPSRPSEGGDR